MAAAGGGPSGGRWACYAGLGPGECVSVRERVWGAGVTSGRRAAGVTLLLLLARDFRGLEPDRSIQPLSPGSERL